MYSKSIIVVLPNVTDKLPTIFVVQQSQGLKCMACGRQSLEGYVTYTGMCKHENDPGEEVQCQELEESASCMSAILRKLIEWFLFVDVFMPPLLLNS